MGNQKEQMYAVIRERLTERLSRQIGESDRFRNMSLYQLIGMLHLIAGHINYLPCWTVAVRSVEELVGEDRLYRRPDHETNPPAQEEPRPTEVVH